MSRQLLSIPSRVEKIFAHGVSLEQGGRLKNTIFCKDKYIYIVNSDETVVLRFGLKKNERIFQNPVAFNANDYDSAELFEEDGRVVLIQKAGGFSRYKEVQPPKMTPQDAEDCFNAFPPIAENTLLLSSDFLTLLRDQLSHIEFKTDDKLNPVIIQRDIYAGSVSQIVADEVVGGLGLAEGNEIQSAFGPLGLRTNDFWALFEFQDSLRFSFSSTAGRDVADARNYCFVESVDPRWDMKGVIAGCLYDELGKISKAYWQEAPTGPEPGHNVKSNRKKENEDGRQEQKDGRSKQTPGAANHAAKAAKPEGIRRERHTLNEKG